MQTDLIVVREYCEKSNIEPAFILMLEEDGLIEIQLIDQEQYISETQLRNLERYSRLYYDLSINVPGIGVVDQLLNQIETLKSEIISLKSHLSTYQSSRWIWEEKDDL